MPFHLPHLGHKHSGEKKHDKDKDKDKAKAEEAAFVPVSPPHQESTSPLSLVSPLPNGHARSPTFGPSSGAGLGLATSPAGGIDNPPHRPSFATAASDGSASQSQLHGILRKSSTNANANTNPTSPSISGSEYTFSSGSGSAFAGVHKRMSSLAFDRNDTIESMSSYDDERRRGSSPSTPATSVSSFNAHCPLPTDSDSGAGGFPFFMMTLSSVSTLSFIALPPGMRPLVLDAINAAWKRGLGKITEVDYQPELMKKHKDKGCEGGVWEVTMKGEAWMPSSAEQVSSKRIILRLLTEFAKEGYNLTSSFRTSAKDSGKDTLIFVRDEKEPDPDPVFFAVAFYSHDRIWIIDAEADVGQSLEEGIKSWWVDGIRDARVRERHCREIRLRGAPWTAHSTTSLISARCIHLTIMKIVTHCQTGYDFVGSVDMADKEEGEMPVTFYRRKRGAGAVLDGLGF